MSNAITEKSFYFAYGSNISSERLQGRVGDIDFYATGVLKNYRLIFNKAGGDGTSKANIEYKFGAQVVGALYPLTERQLNLLDIYEGAFQPPYHYEREEVQVTDSHGKTHTAIAYIATPEKLFKKFVPPSEEYLQLIVEGYEEYGLETDALMKAAKGEDFSNS